MARRSQDHLSGFFDWFKRKPAAAPRVQADLYDALRVSPDSSMDEIKAAFRDLALKFHPDRNPDDPTAERKYAEIASAYAVLSDEAQRAEYDLLIGHEEPSPEGSSRRGLIPREGGPQEVIEEPKLRKISKPLQPKAMFERMFGVAKEEAPKESMFKILAPSKPQSPPARIPVPTSMFSSLNPYGNRVPMMPGIDIPSEQELFQILQTWPLEQIWDIVRGHRLTPGFQKAGAAAIDALAGASGTAAEWEISEVLGIPVRQADEFVKLRGRQSFYADILYPVFDVVTQILDQLKPPDIPGRLFLDWDPTGRVIELIYAENVGRRP